MAHVRLDPRDQPGYVSAARQPLLEGGEPCDLVVVGDRHHVEARARQAVQAQRVGRVDVVARGRVHVQIRGQHAGGLHQPGQAQLHQPVAVQIDLDLGHRVPDAPVGHQPVAPGIQPDLSSPVTQQHRAELHVPALAVAVPGARIQQGHGPVGVPHRHAGVHRPARAVVDQQIDAVGPGRHLELAHQHPVRAPGQLEASLEAMHTGLQIQQRQGGQQLHPPLLVAVLAPTPGHQRIVEGLAVEQQHALGFPPGHGGLHHHRRPASPQHAVRGGADHQRLGIGAGHQPAPEADRRQGADTEMRCEHDQPA